MYAWEFISLNEFVQENIVSQYYLLCIYTITSLPLRSFPTVLPSTDPQKWVHETEEFRYLLGPRKGVTSGGVCFRPSVFSLLNK